MLENYNSMYNLYVKRGLDFILAIVFLLLLWPIYLLIACAIVMDTGFPVFYRAERGGFRNASFRIFKFRSMVQSADKIGGGTTALNDSRITKVGNLLRKTKLDETAQIFNIILGDMSFVGPRPELLKYTSRYAGDEQLIFNVRPGITDYSSLQFISLDEIVGDRNADQIYEEQVLGPKKLLRVKYAREVSFETDCAIFLKTIFKTLKKMIKFYR